MKLSLGIVGLPNVGKSTLFNALTNNQVPAENYPFNTIDPNVGVVPVFDPRIQQLAELIKPKKVTPATVEFWDIAGLVKGAAAGEGLGNQFLSDIRNTAAIVHVVRAFENSNIHHVEETVQPERDIDLINTELIIKDLETIDKRISSTQGPLRANPKLRPVMDMLEKLKQHLESGNLAGSLEFDGNNAEVVEAYQSMFLLTSKPVIYLVNTTESEMQQNVNKIKSVVGDQHLVLGMDIKLESELSELEEDEKQEYLEELGLEEPALARLTREAYKLLGLISFFTAGEQEVRAWTIKQGTKAPGAAGTIHTDFEKKFITSEVVKFQDFVSAGGWLGSKESGKIKLGGKDYSVQDGDVMLFKHNA